NPLGYIGNRRARSNGGCHRRTDVRPNDMTDPADAGGRAAARAALARRQDSTGNSSSSPLRMALARHKSSLSIIDFDDIDFGLSKRERHRGVAPYCSARSSAGPSWRVKLSAQLIRPTWL